MSKKSLGSGLVIGAVIAAGTQAYADVNAAKNNSQANLGEKKTLSQGILYPVPAATVEATQAADPFDAVSSLGLSTDQAKTTDKQIYGGYYYGYGPAFFPGFAPCGVAVTPFAGLTVLAIGAMSFRTRRQRRAVP